MLTERFRIRLDSTDPTAEWNFAPSSPPDQILFCESFDRAARLITRTGDARQWHNPLDALDWLAKDIESQPPSVRWVGYLSYELGRLFENLPPRCSDDLRLPLFLFARHDLQKHSAADESTFAKPATIPLRSNFTRPAYESAVARAIEYIRAGDVYQVNLSHRFTSGMTANPAEIYQRLRQATPAQFGACLAFGDFALLSNSPELFFSVHPDRRIVTRPIKGTRPRLPGMEIVLRDSLKDQAELNMIVDLERNDLSRICRIGSVKVTQERTIEAHPTVYHGVATVEGVLRDNIQFSDLLRAIFPGGSVTGAPKIRAMQIIDELETVRRGPYCGAIGYLAPGGRMEFNMAIRTMIVADGLVHMSVGGGIVADSDPAAEYEETLVKARAMLAALDLSV